MVISTILTYVVTTFSIVFVGLYLFFKKKYRAYDGTTIPYVKPTFPFGNLSIGKSIGDVFKDIYEEHKTTKVLGFWLLHRPCLLINDPNILKKILVQDFNYFQDHGNYANLKEDPLSGNLFSMHGSQWRNLRAKLSPTFTSGKMKSMFPIIEDISSHMQRVIEPVAAKSGVIEIKDLIGRYSTDIIASCAYGIETKSLDDPDSIFRTMGKRVFQSTWPNIIRNVLSFFIPDVARFFNVVNTDPQLGKFFLGAFKDTIDYRKTNKIQRNDFTQLLMQLQDKGFIDNVDDKSAQGDSFTFETAAAQAFVFFIGGYETSSSTLQFTLFELAKNNDIQDRLRKEIMEEFEKSEGKMTYDGIFKLKYMGLVLDETLRKYPIASVMTRACNKAYYLPEVDFTIKEGTSIFISSLGMQNDERYYPNPNVFDPERFTEEEKLKRPNYTYMPFGEGPRFCIGQRFAQMQMRAALFALLSKFQFDVCSETPKKIEFDPKNFVMSPLGGMNLKITTI